MRTTPAGWIGEVSGCFKRCVHAKSPQLCPTLCDSMDCSPPGSSVHEFSRQEYWSGLPCPPPGDLPDPGTEPGSLIFSAVCRRVLYLPERHLLEDKRVPTHDWAKGEEVMESSRDI